MSDKIESLIDDVSSAWGELWKISNEVQNQRRWLVGKRILEEEVDGRIPKDIMSAVREVVKKSESEVYAYVALARQFPVFDDFAKEYPDVPWSKVVHEILPNKQPTEKQSCNTRCENGHICRRLVSES